jgi:hypothetical protein
LTFLTETVLAVLVFLTEAVLAVLTFLTETVLTVSVFLTAATWSCRVLPPMTLARRWWLFATGTPSATAFRT